MTSPEDTIILAIFIASFEFRVVGNKIVNVKVYYSGNLSAFKLLKKLREETFLAAFESNCYNRA